MFCQSRYGLKITEKLVIKTSRGHHTAFNNGQDKVYIIQQNLPTPI